jgi:hypothetical protein
LFKLGFFIRFLQTWTSSVSHQLPTFILSHSLNLKTFYIIDIPIFLAGVAAVKGLDDPGCHNPKHPVGRMIRPFGCRTIRIWARPDWGDDLVICPNQTLASSLSTSKLLADRHTRWGSPSTPKASSIVLRLACRLLHQEHSPPSSFCHG